MKLVSWNVNGLRSVYKKGLLKSLVSLDADIIALQEIKAQEGDLTEIISSFADYQAFFSVATKRGYSGVATLFHNRLACKPESFLRSLNSSPTDAVWEEEGRILASKCEDFTLYNIYFPSGTTGELRQNVKYRFLDYAMDYFSRLGASKCIICGDFNICHRDIDIHHPKVAEKRGLSGFLPEERKWFENFFALGFLDTFRLCHGDIKDAYTWWSLRANSRSKNLGWRIDYFLVSKDLASKVRSAGIHTDIIGSDHCPISLEIEL